MDKKIKNRGNNFTSSETQLLLEVALKHKNVLENKTTNAATWREKDETWDRISREYCASTTGPSRDAKSLRGKYETIKKNIRKDAANEKKALFLTGGGPPVTIKPYTQLEEELRAAMQLSVSGLPAVFDSDDFQGNDITEYQDLLLIAEETDTQASCTPDKAARLLKMPKNQALLVPAVDETGGTLYGEGDVAGRGQEVVEAGIHHKTPTGSKGAVLFKKKCQTSVSAKYEKLSQEKLELIALQKEISRNNLENQKKEHEQRVRHAEEEHALRMEGLRMDNELKRRKLE